MAGREGLALITLEDSVPAFVPEAVRPAVLTVSEAKGLDFHSVCVLDAGRHIERVSQDNARFRGDSDIQGLQKRLAIDQLRVALSRATERLFWLDINPTEVIVRQSVGFLNGGGLEGGVSSCVPAALLKTLEEDELDLEERIQRCQADARQYLEVKPEIAWSRAQQAVTLLGRPGLPAAIADEAARSAANLTLAEVCFSLGFRNIRLAAELGRPDLFMESYRAAVSAQRIGLAAIIGSIHRVSLTSSEGRLQALVDLAQTLARHEGDIEPWLLVELGSKSAAWIEELESALHGGQNAAILIKLLPPFYEVLGVPDRIARTQRLQQRAIQLLIKEKQFSFALEALLALPECDPKLEAVCHEGLRDFRSAADCHRTSGNFKDAFNCYRAIPDLDAAIGLLQQIGNHPAAESLEWIVRLRRLIAERPEKFTKLVTPAEKKLLEELLERSLGVSRRKAAPVKPPRKKAAAPRKRTPGKTQRGAEPHF